MNTVSLVGRISERGVRLDYTPERAKPQLSFSLTVMEMGRDGIARPTYIPIMIVSDNAERLAEVLEPHDLVAITSGKLQWRAGRTKESGKLIVVAYNVDILDTGQPALATLAQEQSSDEREGRDQGDESANVRGRDERSTATKTKRPQPWPGKRSALSN